MVHIKEIPALTFDDVLISPLYSEIASRKDVETSVSFGKTRLEIPIISSNMDTITGIKMAKEMSSLGGLGLIHRYMSPKENLALMEKWDYSLGPIAVSTGIKSRDSVRINLILDFIKRNNYTNEVIICVDIAHGDSKHMIETIASIRSNGFNGTLIAGAVCTPEGTKRLLTAGADIVRVGVGPGSACITRTKTGCGYPQLSAIIECAQVGPIIADGGIKTAGDACKALAAGAKAIMIGGILAGTDCVPGWDLAMKSYEALTDSHKTHGAPSIKFRGMASADARKDFGEKAINAEGISCTVKAKPKDSTKAVIIDIKEGLKSAMSYTNSDSLNSFQENVEFIKVSPAVIKENIPHILSNAKSLGGHS